MSSTLYRNKNLRRPKKSPAQRAQREKAQRKRLIALGMSEEEVNALSHDKVRILLKRPKKVATQAAG